MSDLEASLDDLYRSAPKEFVSRRNELARQLKSAGDDSAAQRVQSLTRPTPAAWAVNQLALGHCEAIEALRGAGERVRAAHASGHGDEFAEAIAERNGRLAECESLARSALESVGAGTGAATLRGVTMTLGAIAAHAGEPLDPPPGRLPAALEPPGFDALGEGFVPRPFEKKAPVKAPEATQQDQLAAAEALLGRAKEKLAAAEEPARAFGRELEAATAAAQDAQRAADAADAALRTARVRAQDADRRLQSARDEVERAERLVELLKKDP